MTETTADGLHIGDTVHRIGSRYDFPPLGAASATVTDLEDGPGYVGIWLDQTGDMRWLLPTRALVLRGDRP